MTPSRFLNSVSAGGVEPELGEPWVGRRRRRASRGPCPTRSRSVVTGGRVRLEATSTKCSPSLRDDRPVRPRLVGDALDRRRRRARRGRAGARSGLSRPAREPDLAPVRVDGEHAVDGPVARGQDADQLAVAVAELQVAEARSARTTRGTRPVASSDAEVVVEVDPGVGRLLDEQRSARRSRRRSDRACSDFWSRERTWTSSDRGRLPVDAGEVDVVVRVGEVQPAGLAARRRRRRRAGPWRWPRPRTGSDASRPSIARPPGGRSSRAGCAARRSPGRRCVEPSGDHQKPGEPVHLLLGDELGEAVGQPVARRPW